jgi:hypothetical protein
MGEQYNAMLADRTVLLLQLQGFAACGGDGAALRSARVILPSQASPATEEVRPISASSGRVLSPPEVRRA